MVIVHNNDDENKENQNDIDPMNTTDNDNNNVNLITSLKATISNLKYDFDQLQLDYHNIDGKYQICLKEHEILRDIQLKYDNKCHDYDQLTEEYDGVKIELLTLKKSSKMYLNQNKDLQQQKNDLTIKYEKLQRENIECEHELHEFKTIVRRIR